MKSNRLRYKRETVRLKSKFMSDCKRCFRKIPKGVDMLYNKEYGSFHISCGEDLLEFLVSENSKQKSGVA